MSDFPPLPDGMPEEFYNLCKSVIAKRPRTVIIHILTNGFITTEELKDLYGYNHPPRAIRDVREQGIPLETYRIADKTGRQIAAYRFALASEIVAGRVGGRKAFSKLFKEQLIQHYGARSTLSNEPLEARYLQIDHRIPYQVAGNDALENVEEYMLLDASAQRAKSWSCENCENFQHIKAPTICRDCFWAFPENYKHIALNPERRLDIVWSGKEVIGYDALTEVASQLEITPQELVKQAIEAYLNSSE